jgi:hypothetical protein
MGFVDQVLRDRAFWGAHHFIEHFARAVGAFHCFTREQWRAHGE